MHNAKGFFDFWRLMYDTAEKASCLFDLPFGKKTFDAQSVHVLPGSRIYLVLIVPIWQHEFNFCNPPKPTGKSWDS